MDWKEKFNKYGCGLDRTIKQVTVDKERLEQIQEIVSAMQSPLQDYVNENILSAWTVQKTATLLCQYMTFVSLVKEMRAAQKAYENAPRKTMEEIDALETYVFEMLETEKKVDTYLKYMEEYK